MIDFRHNSTKTTEISGYKPFYIQKANSAYPVDTRTQWGLVAKTNPFPAMPNPKEPYANDWLDEDGLDEYNASMFYDPIEFDVAFYVKAYASGGSTAAEVLRTWLLEFFNYVRDGEFMTYDSYTGIGFRKVRFNGYSEDYFRARGDWAAATITVKFKANDPTDRMFYKTVSYGLSVRGEIIAPQYAGYTDTGATTPNKTVYNSSVSSPSAGTKLSVYFINANTAGSPALKFGNNAAVSIIHVPAGNFKAGTYYFFEYTGSVWDCLGTL